MRNIWTIARREYRHFFISPIAYVVAFIILLLLGIIFYANVLASTTQQYTPDVTIVLSPLVSLLLFSIPAITMHTLSDEQRNGTLELLLTAPVRDSEVVVGKWLGSFLFVATITLVTWVFPLILNQIVTPGIDQGLMIGGYAGLFLLLAALVAIGVAASSFFGNQIAAFFATLGIFLVLWMISYPAQALGASGGTFLRYLDMSEHFYNTFLAGIIDLKDIIYYVSITVLFLFIGSASIEMRRWR
jgi:ABC-2 type transport system permease protein